MKKKLLIFILIITGVTALFYFSNTETKAEKLQKKYANFRKNSPFAKTLQLSEEEREERGLPPNAFYEQEYLNEMDPHTGTTHPENYLRVQQNLKAARKGQRVPGDATDNNWVERGPNNVGGRTRVVLFDPNDATHKRVFAGGVSGGLWVNNDITDANSSWTRVGIDENLSISCITVDPNNSQIMYVGTGESYTGDQAVGNGVWKTTDGGNSWVNVYSNNFDPNPNNRLYYINDIKAWNDSSTNKTVVFIGVGGAYNGGWTGLFREGLYKTIDDGANWTKVTLPAAPVSNGSTAYEPNDLEIGADNTIWMSTESSSYNTGGGTILKSTDGVTFTVAYTEATGLRTQIAVSKTNKDKIYALFNTTGDPKMLVTTDGFATNTVITLPNDADTDIKANDFTRGQAFYDLMLEVDPTNDANVYIGGIDLFKSTNSGTAWTQISHWYGGFGFQNVHADQHALAFDSTSRMVFGNDGGVFYSNDSGGTISSRNKGYNVTQFYHGDIGQQTSKVLLIAGAQDNGSPFINGASAGINSSFDLYGGDGAYSYIDKDGQYIIVSYIRNVKSLIKLPYNQAEAQITIANDQTTGQFINPSELDDNLNILYTNSTPKDGGLDSIARFTNLTTTPVRKNFSDPKLKTGVTVLKVSPFTTGSTKLFVGTNGDIGGKLFRVENANTGTGTWTDITGANFDAGSISAIAFGKTESEILVTFHNYGVKSIWFTQDGGTTWQNKEGNFPDIPVKAIMMNPLNNNEVIIGTQLGVWKTGNFKDASPSWTQSYNGMSNVKVTSFSLRTVDNTVLATTFGRGMFTGKFTAGATASIDDVLADKKVFTMYPTVSDGNFTVFAKNTLGKSTLHLFDINGKQVFTKQLNFKNQSKQPVSVNLSSGVYIVNLIDKNNKKASGKIIIK